VAVTDSPIAITNNWTRLKVGTVGGPGGAANVGVLRIDDAGDAVDVWGFQLELGSFATSYLPTTASQTTRAADVVSMMGSAFSNWYNPSSGVFLLNSNGPNAYGSAIIGLGTGAGAVSRAAGGEASWSNGIAILTTGNVDLNWSDGAKIAAAYDPGGRALCLNGGTVAVTDTTVSDGGKLVIGAGYGGSSFLNGHIRALRYYRQRLPNVTLQSMTA
jgi:hypothetical protein